MWKYVSRRVKDTLERTCNVFDVGRTTFCSSGIDSRVENAPTTPADDRVVAYNVGRKGVSWFRPKCGRFGGKGKEQGAGQEREPLHPDGQSWISALTWSGAIVCGWYTSQYMCLRRKRMGWTPKGQRQHSCMYANLLLTTTRSLHTNVTSRIALAAPPPPSGIDVDLSSIGALLQNVNNPVAQEEARRASTTKDAVETLNYSSRSKSDRSSSLESAVAEFSFTIGEIEYQFAVQDLMAENYKSAVNHLKLATTHHHPAATFNLGLCYEKGLGVDRDLKTAMQCYSVASALGHAKAMYNLGVFYVRGWGGLKRSKKAARECFDSAARLGVQEAKLALAMQQERQVQRMEPKHMSSIKDSGIGVHAF